MAWARRYARSSQDAEDIAQDALLRAWRHRDRLRDDGRFYAWLARIVRNEAARRYSRADAQTIAVEDIDRHGETSAGVDATVRIDVELGLRQLDHGDRELLRLRYEQDLTQPAIARLLDLPEGTVKVRLHRARAKLRGALE